MTHNEDEVKAPVIGDLAGAGQIINSEIAKRSYDDALSPPMQEVGALSRDTLKAFRLFTAPLQLAAAYQDRFAAFCERVREKVPEEKQKEAPPEIAAPVMQAFATTSDDSPLMAMFEELMAKAINADEADKLSPDFPGIIKSLSPHQAKLVRALLLGEQHFVDALASASENLILQRLGQNFSYADFGGADHHLTLMQDLAKKQLVTITNVSIIKDNRYPDLTIPEGCRLSRMTFRLSMFGRWFASACVQLANIDRPQ